MLRVSAVGCAGSEVIEWSSGFVCDESEPSIVGEPVLASASGFSALGQGDTATVTFSNVFQERDSPMVSSGSQASRLLRARRPKLPVRMAKRCSLSRSARAAKE